MKRGRREKEGKSRRGRGGREGGKDGWKDANPMKMREINDKGWEGRRRGERERGRQKERKNE